jgi:hypothetical protein
MNPTTKRTRGRPKKAPTKTIAVRVPESVYTELKEMFNKIANTYKQEV